MHALALFIATAAYSGYVPVAPGTAGSVVGVMLFVLMRATGRPLLEVAVVIAVVAGGVWAASVGERHFGRRDPRTVVIDEVAGMLITLFWLPISWSGAVIGFVAFRGFDIVKPFPARAAEALPRGWGVMADDVVAGLYAHLTVRLLAWLAPALMLS